MEEPNEPRWKETIKEMEYDEDGNLRPKRVVYEQVKNPNALTKKDYIDYFFKIIAALAIFVPLIIFLQQQKAEIKKQKMAYQVDVFTSTLSELHLIDNYRLNTSGYIKCKNRLVYELYPKLLVAGNKDVTDSFIVVYDLLRFSTMMTEMYGALVNVSLDFRYGEKPTQNTILDSAFIVPLDLGANSEYEFMRKYTAFKEWTPSNKTSATITAYYREKSLEIMEPAYMLVKRGVPVDQERNMMYRLQRQLDSAKLVSYHFPDFISSNISRYVKSMDSICLSQIGQLRE